MPKFNRGDTVRTNFGDRVLVKVLEFDFDRDLYKVEYLERSYLYSGDLFRSIGDTGYVSEISINLVKANSVSITTMAVTKYRVYYDGGDWEFSPDHYERAYGFALAARKFGKLERFVSQEVTEKEIEL